MSVQRFLSKRDKHRDSGGKLQLHYGASGTDHPGQLTNAIDPGSASDFYGLFVEKSKASSSEEQKVKSVKQKIIQSKAVLLHDSHVLWAIRSAFSNGNIDLAYDLLLAMSNASEGIVIPYDPHIRLLGAVNRHAVTCFLDSTLFAMFSRLDSFEAMLYNTFEDRPRCKLAFLLRLWVNLLRAGKLITTDITYYIQQSLSECGWEDAAELHQQDASEAFTFITEKLKLPLLTLKMDMFHAGKQDADDHRFINERLLEVAIPASEEGKRKDIKLEDCLEDYFNNRIEVRRFLERRSTISSMRSFDSSSKTDAVHVETLEIDPDSSPSTPLSPLPSYLSSARPSRNRTSSIIQERFVPDSLEMTKSISPGLEKIKTPASRLRGGSVRKEVVMPAWQFFSLIPWYTDNAPSNDAQVAHHFSSKRPILGLCLKRYSFLPDGKAIRLNTFVDIPIEIGLPHFIQDDHMEESGPLFGNFKLSLQSVVCHRGNSVDSGHYISLVRGTSRSEIDEDAKSWMRFDDLARERVTMINGRHALMEETPYLLFYQIMPVDGDPGNLTAGEIQPPYAASQTDSTFASLPSPDTVPSSTRSPPSSNRTSLDLASTDEKRGRASPSIRRPSAVVFDEFFPRTPGSDLGDHSDHRKSLSLTRTGSKNSRSGNVITKTLSGLTGGSKHKDTSSFTDAVPSVEITAVPVLAPSAAPATAAAVLSATKTTDPAKADATTSKLHKRDKSRSRLGLGIGKKNNNGSHEDPDRECVVM